MKVPWLPLYVDIFTATATGSDVDERVFILSHFHTDHTRGLSPRWDTGRLLCTRVTQVLLTERYGPSVGARTTALPFWERTPLLVGPSMKDSVDRSQTAVPTTVFLTLLPAYHIPGSCMCYFETPHGNILYTGDMKFDHRARQCLAPFFATHTVDHLYVDDTWLHLGWAVDVDPPPSHNASSLTTPSPLCGSTATSISSGHHVLCKLLNEEQVEEAITAIQKRMERMMVESSRSISTSSVPGQPPYHLLVYLHNQFGKEWLVQRLAMRLGTRALIDVDRYNRLEQVVGAMETEFDGIVPSQEEHEQQGAANPCACRWRALGGEATVYHRLSMTHFSAMDATREPRFVEEARNGLKSAPHPGCLPQEREAPLIEVVGSRKLLAQRIESQAATPHYGLIMSGWASRRRNQSSLDTSSMVWHMPTTLHSSPQEIIDLVALLRPRSVTPLHEGSTRGVVLMQRLGPYLRQPFVNELPSDSTGGASLGADDPGSRPSIQWTCPLPDVPPAASGGREEREGNPKGYQMPVVADIDAEDVLLSCHDSSVPCWRWSTMAMANSAETHKRGRSADALTSSATSNRVISLGDLADTLSMPTH